MDKLIRTLIKERRITLFLAVIVCIFGVYSYYYLPRQESPEVNVPVAMVITPYPGASPVDMKDLVTSEIEDELSELDGIDYVQGTSEEGLSIVIALFDFEADVDKAMQDVRNAVTDVQGRLPNGCFPSYVNTDLSDAAGIIISLSGENYTYEQLASFGEQFEDKLSTIDGISKFTIEGELEREIKVDVDIAMLNQLGLSIDDVANVIKAQNVEIPSGEIDYDVAKIKVKTPGIYTSLEDIRNTIIGVSRETGIVTRLSDVAHIYMGLEDDVEKFKQNGKNAVLLTGYFKKNENVVIIGKDVRKAIDEVKAQLPEDLVVEEVIYQPDDVSRSVNDFMINLVEGIIFVIIVVFLGMGFRNALVVSTAIPLSIIITFAVMYLSGIPIHQMSLTALIVALGVLVDNAIVISDTIQVRIDGGEDIETASYKGTSMSSIPIFTATLTTVAAFSPLLGMPGAAGDFLGSIPKVLIISIIAAYMVSMFVTPPMAAVLFEKSKKNTDEEGKIRLFFKNLLNKALKMKLVTVISTFTVLILVINVLIPQLPSEFFPYAEKDIFYIDIETELAGDMDATEKLTDKIADLIMKEPEITSCTVAVGNGLPKFYLTLPTATPAKDFGQLACKFYLGDKKIRRFDDKQELAEYIQNMINENISGGKATVKLLANAAPSEAKVVMRVSGDNLDRLREVKNELEAEIGKIPGTSNIRDDMKDETFQLEVNVDEDKASNLGISKYDIQKQINVALYGSKTSVYRKDGEQYNILIQSNIDNTSSLENLEIKSSITGKKIPLKQFATVGLGSKLDSIGTYNGEQSVEILLNELPGYNAVTIENIIEYEVLPKVDTSGTNITFDGEREEMATTFGKVMLLAVCAVFLIYIVLLIQFRSFIQPLVILVTVPLSLIGSGIGLFIFKKPLSLTAVLGIIALIGLVVKNGILLLEYINDARKEGYTIDEACVDAVGKRFNAIILSALTTIVGLLPLAFSGSGLFGPMAISLMFGLLVSTFLTMVVIPVIYSLIETFLENKRLDKKQYN